MKIFDDSMQVAQVGNYQFSGARPEKLGATEYTLVTIVTDKTGSVTPFSAELLAMKRAVVEACQKSPRRDFLMLRNVEFSTTSEEVHGFAELRLVDPQQYVEPKCNGATALFDATYLAVAATNEYGRILADQDFGVNAVVFVITDGDDNASAFTPAQVAQEIGRGVQNEWLESLNVILIGVNAQQYRRKLEQFKRDGQLSQYVDIADASAEKLARLADFVSRSISSQSQSLGTGGPSQLLTF